MACLWLRLVLSSRAALVSGVVPSLKSCSGVFIRRRFSAGLPLGSPSSFVATTAASGGALSFHVSSSGRIPRTAGPPSTGIVFFYFPATSSARVAFTAAAPTAGDAPFAAGAVSWIGDFKSNLLPFFLAVLSTLDSLPLVVDFNMDFSGLDGPGLLVRPLLLRLPTQKPGSQPSDMSKDMKELESSIC